MVTVMVVILFKLLSTLAHACLAQQFPSLFEIGITDVDSGDIDSARSELTLAK